MARIIFENAEFLIEDSEGLGFSVLNNKDYKLGRRLTEKKTARVFYVDRDSFRVFEHCDGSLREVTDPATLRHLDKQRK